MDIQQLEKALQVRYVKLHFGLRMTEDTRLPMNKVSALRGGIGEMLLRANFMMRTSMKEIFWSFS